MSLVLPVGDLLRNVGTQDSLVLEDVMIESLPSWSTGISLSCQINAINEYTVYVKLTDIQVQIPAICDQCGVSYVQDVEVDQYDIRFGIPVQIHKPKHNQDIELDYDFAIDSKTETIDLTEAVYQSVMMSMPIVSHCPACIKSDHDGVDEYDLYA